jgi:hypothetical protein
MNPRRIVQVSAAVSLAVFSWLLAPPPAVAQGLVCDRVFTLNADLDEGILVNVNRDVPDQLQLSRISAPFPFVNIACSARGTIVRIDVNTGAILGEYLTAPDDMGRNPLRTTVDELGNVRVANRDEYLDGKGSVARIALVIGGVRCDADGTPNPGGQQLKPPFLYSTAVDRDGNGRFTPDGMGVGTATAELRAERCGASKAPGDGRVYHVSFTASDGRGGTCSGTVQVGVPHDLSKAVIDGRPLYDSTAVAP